MAALLKWPADFCSIDKKGNSKNLPNPISDKEKRGFKLFIYLLLLRIKQFCEKLQLESCKKIK